MEPTICISANSFVTSHHRFKVMEVANMKNTVVIAQVSFLRFSFFSIFFIAFDSLFLKLVLTPDHMTSGFISSRYLFADLVSKVLGIYKYQNRPMVFGEVSI